MIWIIIPAYNEAQNLPTVMQGIAAALHGLPYKAFIVNDGSHDETLAVANQLAQNFPIEVLDHKVNRGVAQVFRTGIIRAASIADENDAIIIMEGDGTSDPRLLPKMTHIIAQGTDVVIASRYVKGGRYQGFPFKRMVLSKAANSIFQIFFPVQNVLDYSIFYRAYRAECLQKA
ncbi:MAG: glycosyltransferase, partial [Patescibacteria group bacterium]